MGKRSSKFVVVDNNSCPRAGRLTEKMSEAKAQDTAAYRRSWYVTERQKALVVVVPAESLEAE